jgi:hypothetical protein
MPPVRRLPTTCRMAVARRRKHQMPQNERHARGQRAAGLHLRRLILQPGPYRDEWEQHAHDVPPDEIRQDAVCMVIAEHLYETGAHDETDTGLARTLKDRVSRAFSGRGLSLQTLRWFEAAFRLSPHDAQRLHELYRGVLRPTVIAGRLPPPAAGGMKSGHETTMLLEHHFIGRDGVPARHHTQQTVRALVDGMTSYQYRIDTPEADVRVVRGGQVGPVYQLSEQLWAVDITFHHPLRYGDEAYFDYWTIFHYSQPPAAEFRRGSHRRVEHLDLRLEFHPGRLPRNLWWAEWADYRRPDEAIVEREAVALDEELSAHRYLEAIEHTVVGYYWEW